MKNLTKPLMERTCTYLTLKRITQFLEKHRHEWQTRKQIKLGTGCHEYVINFTITRMKEKKLLEIAENGENLFFMIKLKPEYKEGSFP